MPPSPELDSARERVVRLLTDRYADHSLTTSAFEAQLDRLYSLPDVAALDAMARELAVPSALPLPTPLVTSPAAPSSPGADVAWRRGAYLPARVREHGCAVGVMSAVRRSGEWEVPRTLRVLAVMSEVVLDLRDALLPAEGCEVDVGALMANVKVLLPPGVEAQVTLAAFMGAARDHTHAAAGVDRGPRVRVAGSSVMSEVTVLQGEQADLAALELDD